MINKETEKHKLVTLEAELTALSDTLGTLETDYKKALIAAEFYYKKRQAVVAEYEVNLNQLNELLKDAGAGDVGAVIKEAAAARPDDQEAKDKLVALAEEAEKKGWAQNLVAKVKAHSGDIADMAIHVGIRIGKSLLGMP